MIHNMCPLHDTSFLSVTCRKHNDMLYENAVSEKLIVPPCDAVQSQTEGMLMVKSAAKYADNHGILRIIPAAIDLVYAIP